MRQTDPARAHRQSRLSGWIALAVFLVPTSAGAIEISILGPSSVTVQPGEAFTIDLAVDNASMTSTFGIDVHLSGLAAAGAVATSGRAALSYFVGFCIPIQCFGGLNVPNDAFFDANDLPGSGIYVPGGDSIVLVQAGGLSATSFDGSIDPGIDGPNDVPSPRDVTITLVANTLGTHVLTVGGIFLDGTNVLPIPGSQTYTVTVVPEPGTALLFGFGLAGLGVSRRHGPMRKRKESP